MKKINYLEVSYDPLKKPKTEYPSHLMSYITKICNLKSGTVVDVGCGRGDQLVALEKLGFEVVGLDNEPNSVDILNYHICDITSDTFPIADETIDLVFSKSVIEHLYLPQIEHYMEEILRITKPRGYVVLMTPDWQFTYKDFYTEYSHVMPFTVKSLEQCARMYGLVDVSVKSFIQLPIVWRFPWLKVLCDFLSYLPLPKSSGKFVHWSKDRVLLCIARKKD
jgi:ubiquinone/menaquinone biosynthesis C-methylase UbiE